MEQLKTALIIDGSALIYRAYHALPPFTAPDGTPTNALHGFITMLIKLLQSNPDYVAVCMDTPVPTFRKKLLKTYQATRPKAPEKLSVQFPLVIEFLDKASIPRLQKEGFEADDVVGTLVSHFNREEPEVMVRVVTGDRDLLQLVAPNVQVMMPQIGVSKLKIMDEASVEVAYGVKPEQIIDFKALVGDSSDNYKGIPGIGPVKAAQLLQSHKTLEGIYEHIDTYDETLKKQLTSYKDDVVLSQKLATIVRNVPITISIETLQFKEFSIDETRPFLEKYALWSIIKTMEKVRGDRVDDDSRSTGKVVKDQLSFF